MQSISVLGCGLMGAGIAQVCATAGYPTLVRDVDQAALARGRASIEKSLGKLVEKAKLSAADRDADTAADGIQRRGRYWHRRQLHRRGAECGGLLGGTLPAIHGRVHRGWLGVDPSRGPVFHPLREYRGRAAGTGSRAAGWARSAQWRCSEKRWQHLRS